MRQLLTEMPPNGPIQAPLTTTAMTSGLIVVFAAILSAPVNGADKQLRPESEVFRSVDIGGRSLRLLCAGDGSPTVVIAPSGGSMEAVFSWDPPVGWAVVFREVQRTTRVCIYDRAGVGKSDAVPGPPITSVNVATDLQALLHKGAVPMPYVFAGQSFGGMNVRAYAHLYPADVAGMVLVDSSHPDQYVRFSAVLPKRVPGESAILRGLREGPEGAGVDFAANARLVRAMGGIGDKPLIVLTRSPGWSGDAEVPDEWEALVEPVWQQLQRDLVGLSSNSKQIIAKKAGHNIQFDEPQLVVAAILDVVTQVRRRVSPNTLLERTGEQ
jgi:pimeloyl-ACP methyl ester carboxylesterase